MEMSSEDGTKDLLLGIIVLIVLSGLAFLMLTNTSLVLDNALPIILVVLFVSIIFGLGNFFSDILLSIAEYLNIVKNSEDYDVVGPKIPEENQLEMKDAPN